MSTHTQGLWHIGIRTAHSKRDVYGPLGELIALADAVFTDLATAQANARLIAAAPELLEACKMLLESVQVAMNHEEGDVFGAAHNDTIDAINLAAQAIAKAEGRA